MLAMNYSFVYLSRYFTSASVALIRYNMNRAYATVGGKETITPLFLSLRSASFLFLINLQYLQKIQVYILHFDSH